MATFEAQVEALTSLSIDGSSAPTQAELSQFLTDGAKEVINLMPSRMLAECTERSTLNHLTTTLANMDEKGPVVSVLRHDGTISQPCRLVPASKQGRIQDSSDMEYATASDPAYYLYNNVLTVYPTP